MYYGEKFAAKKFIQKGINRKKINRRIAIKLFFYCHPFQCSALFALLTNSNFRIRVFKMIDLCTCILQPMKKPRQSHSTKLYTDMQFFLFYTGTQCDLKSSYSILCYHSTHLHRLLSSWSLFFPLHLFILIDFLHFLPHDSFSQTLPSPGFLKDESLG